MKKQPPKKQQIPKEYRRVDSLAVEGSKAGGLAQTQSRLGFSDKTWSRLGIMPPSKRKQLGDSLTTVSMKERARLDKKYKTKTSYPTQANRFK